jgi:hypothetical protein
MHPDTALGVTAELNHLLKEGWTTVRETECIRVVPPQTAASDPRFNDVLQDEVWRIARFIGYGDFVSIERKADGSYRVHSRITNGGSFEVVFEPYHS